jgi:NADPH-dependent 2,4-dienoyl-CoA reductase/sulfur reductase-like enzyme
MAANRIHFKYVIVGGGVAGASAVDGIREVDKNGTILIICSEPQLPYNRPPLSKGLWLGKTSLADIFVHDAAFYESMKVTVENGDPAESIDARKKTVICSSRTSYSYDSLLVATGGTPRTFSGGQAGIEYYRYLDDFVSLHKELTPGKTAAVIGGGFIGSEMAVVLSANGIGVTMVFPDPYPCAAVFPPSLGTAVMARFAAAGIRLLPSDKAVSFNVGGNQPVITTAQGETIVSDCIIAGIGILPSTEIAENAGLRCDNGIVVDEQLCTSDHSIFAAGDVARFPCTALGSLIRVEHWDNAVMQGRLAGRNMAGAHDPYTHLPYFFSDLFKFGYEAVGDVNASYEVFEDWITKSEKGVIYYLKDQRCVGVLLLNVWEKCDAAREIIRAGKRQPATDLRGCIR